MEEIYFLVGWDKRSQESFYISVVSYNLKFNRLDLLLGFDEQYQSILNLDLKFTKKS